MVEETEQNDAPELAPGENAEPTEVGTPVAEEVVQRDFRRPRRFSRAFLDELVKSFGLAVPQLETALAAHFKTPVNMEIEAVAEASADGLFDDLEAPFALAGFQVDGQPGWIRWDTRGAVGAIELLLGANEEPVARELEGIERMLLQDVLKTVVDGVAQAAALEASDVAVARQREDIADWRGAGENAESHRVHARLRVEGLGEPSHLHVYLPGIRFAGRGPEGAIHSALPDHLHRVKIDLSAHLGASDIPLSDLLSLEVGDVVPLGTGPSDPLILRVEGQPCGTSEMGSARGNRAIRILTVNPVLEDLS